MKVNGNTVVSYSTSSHMKNKVYFFYAMTCMHYVLGTIYFCGKISWESYSFGVEIFPPTLTLLLQYFQWRLTKIFKENQAYTRIQPYRINKYMTNCWYLLRKKWKFRLFWKTMLEFFFIDERFREFWNKH